MTALEIVSRAKKYDHIEVVDKLYKHHLRPDDMADVNMWFDNDEDTVCVLMRCDFNVIQDSEGDGREFTDIEMTEIRVHSIDYAIESQVIDSNIFKKDICSIIKKNYWSDIETFIFNSIQP